MSWSNLCAVKGVVLACLLWCCLSTTQALAGSADGGSNPADWSEFGWGANGCSGDVEAMVRASDGTIYLAGSFSACGDVAANNVARWDPQLGQFEAVGAGVHGRVLALAVSDTDLYVGGSFDLAGGSLAANNVARYSRTSDTWSVLGNGPDIGTNDEVYALALGHGALYVGGNFTRAGNLAVKRIAQFNLAQSQWNSLGTGNFEGVSDGWQSTPSVRSLLTHGDRVFVGGTFRMAGGEITGGVAAFNAVSQSWSTAGSNFFSAAWVSSLAMFNGRLIAAGAVGLSTTDYGVKALDLSTGQWSDMLGAALFSARPSAMSASATRIYVGGGFGSVGAQPIKFIAQYIPETMRWETLDSSGTDVNDYIGALAVVGDRLYAGGLLTIAGNNGVNRVAQFDISTKHWSKMGNGEAPSLNRQAEAAVFDGTAYYVAGSFRVAGGEAAVGLARYDPETAIWSSLSDDPANALDGQYTALAVQSGGLIAGGRFNFAGAQALNNIGRFDLASKTWQPLGQGVDNGVNASVRAIAVIGTDIYVAGNFNAAGNMAARRIARFDTISQQWSVLGVPGMDGVYTSTSGGDFSFVVGLAAHGTDLYVAGVFDQAGGLAASKIAKYDTIANTWSPLGSGLQFGDPYCLTLDQRNLYVAGGFTVAGGVSARRMARYELQSGQWSAMGTGVNDFLDAQTFGLYVHGSSVYAAGGFSLPGSRLAQLNRSTGTWSTLAPAPENEMTGTIRAIVGNGKTFLIAGDFAQAGGKVNVNAAEYAIDRLFSDSMED